MIFYCAPDDFRGPFPHQFLQKVGPFGTSDREGTQMETIQEGILWRAKTPCHGQCPRKIDSKEGTHLSGCEIL